jgi:aryl-alcohol dehydrogenase-like predicted oxidoreductase
MNLRQSRIGLGTAQWGNAYGVANQSGKTSVEEVASILATARSSNIQVIDTAALYGEAEEVLGLHNLDNLRIVTKTSRFLHSPITAADSEELIKTFSYSLARLRIPSVYGLLVHHADDLLVSGGKRLVDALHFLRESGKVDRIGVSVYDGQQIESVLEQFTPDLVQLPLSVFDQRLINDGSINRLASLGIEIHARSVFLQGLILMDLDSVPDYFAPWLEQLREWHSACASQNILPQHVALSFVCDQPEIACCLVGVQNCDQLSQLLTGLDEVPNCDASKFASSDLGFINPVNWEL